MDLTYEVRPIGSRWRATARDASGLALAEMTWDKGTRVIDHIWTHPMYRRRGIATAVFRYAVANAPARPIHSRNRTESGRAWVASLRRTV